MTCVSVCLTCKVAFLHADFFRKHIYIIFFTVGQKPNTVGQYFIIFYCFINHYFIVLYNHYYVNLYVCLWVLNIWPIKSIKRCLPTLTTAFAFLNTVQCFSISWMQVVLLPVYDIQITVILNKTLKSLPLDVNAGYCTKVQVSLSCTSMLDQ